MASGTSASSRRDTTNAVTSSIRETVSHEPGSTRLLRDVRSSTCWKQRIGPGPSMRRGARSRIQSRAVSPSSYLPTTECHRRYTGAAPPPPTRETIASR